MISVPRFAPQFNVEVFPPDKVFLMSESGYFTLDAQSVALVAPLIDGRRSVDEIVDAVSGQVSMTQAYYVLATLENRGYTEPATDEMPAEVAGFWSSLGVRAADAARRLRESSVELLTIGDVSVAALRAHLDELGISSGAPAATHRVVLVDDYLRPELQDLNRAAEPWLIAKPNGMLSWLGPLFVPGETACWECLRQRLEANREVDTFLRVMAHSRDPFPARPQLPSTLEVAAAMTATEVAKWVVLGDSPGLRDRVVTMHHGRLATRDHRLVRRPQCPACGDPRLQASLPAPIEYVSTPKRFVADGGHRTSNPEDTLRRLEHHVSPITGIVNELIRITDESDPLQHVYVSGANLAFRNYSYRNLKRTLRSKSCGKGVSDVQAKVSAIGEAIERYSGTFRGDEARLWDTMRGLGEAAVDPRLVMQFSAAQYAAREQWNAEESLFNSVPHPFDEDARMEWSPVWSMTRRERRYLPTAYCYYSYPVSFEEHFCAPDSNGAAAGNTREEAMLQGFLELVERDSVALWWYSRARRPALDLESFGLPFALELRTFHASVGRDLWALDLTADLGVPAFIAISRRLDGPPEEIIFAPAAHLDPRIALLRALTELNQMLPAVLDVDEHGEYKYDDAECVRWWKTAALANQPYLSPSPTPPTRLEAFAFEPRDDIRDDLVWCQSAVERMGHELLVLDQTRPDTGLAVVKVIVPGLRHFWARFAPGRLYEAPPALGWIERRLAEHELNPIPIFI